VRVSTESPLRAADESPAPDAGDSPQLTRRTRRLAHEHRPTLRAAVVRPWRGAARPDRPSPAPTSAPLEPVDPPDGSAQVVGARRRQRARSVAEHGGSAAARAGTVVVGGLAIVALGVELVYRGEPAVTRWTGWAAPALALLLGYRWPAGEGFRAGLGLWWRALARPYVGWLVLLGGPVLAQEALAGRPLEPRLHSLWWGGLALEPPLSGHWLAGALVIAMLLAVCAAAWLVVDAVWLLPAALARSYGGPLLVAAPLALGLGATVLTWLLTGRLVRLTRRWIGVPVAVLLGAAGAAGLVLAPLPLEPRLGVAGLPVAGPLAAGALVAGVLVLVERAAQARPTWAARPATRLATRLATVQPVLPVALYTIGVGSYLVPTPWPAALHLAATLLVAAGCAALVSRLPRRSWLTGSGTVPGRGFGWPRWAGSRLRAGRSGRSGRSAPTAPPG